jgi:hypothetical protein
MTEVFNILCLLGFDPECSRQKYCLAVPIEPATLFSRPNPKNFEVIIHFLLDRFDPIESQKASKAAILMRLNANHEECHLNNIYLAICTLLAYL